jgi:hypothetical protein
MRFGMLNHKLLLLMLFKLAGLLRSARRWGVLGVLLALAVLATGGSIPTTQPVLGQIRQPRTPQTLDDLFEAVARIVPDFGGMFLTDNEQVLQVYLLDPSPEKVRAVGNAIVQVFGQIIPEGGIKALKGQYGFLQLREWYTRMVGPILSTPGVTFTDIDEAKNRLGIGIETRDVEARVVEQLGSLGIQREAVAIEVTGPIVPLAHKVTDPYSPREGGYIITRLLCNQTGIGITGGTLGFNVRGLGTTLGVGFVTNSHNTQVLWDLDTSPPWSFPPADFYQSPGFFPAQLVGAETVDPQGFMGGPCPAGMKCRYSDSAFVRYNPNVAFAQGRIARTTGITTSIATPILTVSHGGIPAGEFWIVARPSLPYLAGLTLNKVGQRTGWTQGKIQMTCANIPQPVPSVQVCKFQTSPGTLLCQYTVAHPTNDVVNSGDSGSPVFRILPSPLIQFNAVELYGILWGRFLGSYKTFIFSPIGGVTFQITGIQTDLGPFSYCVPGSNPPC